MKDVFSCVRVRIMRSVPANMHVFGSAWLEASKMDAVLKLNHVTSLDWLAACRRMPKQNKQNRREKSVAPAILWTIFPAVCK